MLILGSILVMSFALGGVIALTHQARQDSLREAKIFEARLLAESGIALGTHPDVLPDDPVLQQEFEDSGYQLNVIITSEQGRILINDAGQDWMVEALRELFSLWGLTADNAVIAAESIGDWVDADTDARPRGAESEYYAGLGYDDYPRDAPLSSLEELLLVRGMDKVAKKKTNWRDSFTLYGDGELDLNAADAEVIAALAAIPISDAESFVSTRNGADGILGTDDDELFEDTDEEGIYRLLGISDSEANELGVVFTLQGTTARIESQATLPELRYSLIVIADRGSGDQLARIWR